MIIENAKVFSWPGGGSGSGGGGVTSFKYDGTIVEVYYSDSIPGNNVPLPVTLVQIGGQEKTQYLATSQDVINTTVAVSDMSAKLPSTLGQKTADQSLSVVHASDAPVIAGYLEDTTVKSVRINTSVPSASTPFPTKMLGSNGITAEVTSSGFVQTNLPANNDATNSSITPLGANAVFTGAAFAVYDYATLSIFVTTDQASATNGLQVQFSADGTNWDHTPHAYTVAIGNLSYNIPVEGRYARVVYTNGPVAQGVFRLASTWRKQYVPPSMYTIEQSIYDTTLATPTKSVIFGKTTGGGGGYVPAKVNPSGALTVDATVTSSVLPTGAATETTLNSIYGLENATTASTVLISGIAFVVDTLNRGSLTFTTSGSWTGSVSILGSDDNVNFANINAYDLNAKDAVSSFTGNLTASINCAGFRYIKFFGSFTGSVTLNYVLSRVVSGTVITSSLPTGNNKIGNVDLINGIPAGTNNIGSVNVAALPATAANNSADGSVTGGLSGTKSSLAGAVYNSTAPTLTTGQQVALQVDSSGNLKTTAAITIPSNANGSYAEVTNLTTTAQTFTVPVNAVGFILEALSDNTANIRYKIGAAATTTSGMRMEPGRDSGYVPCAANISVIAESGSDQVVTVQWVLTA